MLGEYVFVENVHMCKLREVFLLSDTENPPNGHEKFNLSNLVFLNTLILNICTVTLLVNEMRTNLEGKLLKVPT